MKRRSFLIISLVALFTVGLIGGIFLKREFFFTKVVPTFTSAALSSPEVTPTPPPEETYILMGDTGSGLPSQKEVAEAIQNFCLMKNCKFGVILGDVIYEEGVRSVNDTQFQTKFEQPYAGLSFPFYIALGNHDYLGCVQCYLDYASKSSKWIMPARYYSFVPTPDVAFFVIDTERFNDEQQTWLKQAIADSQDKAWKIVMGHRPIESAEISKVKEDWSGKTELFEEVCNNADFYVSGHAHVLEDRGQFDNCTVRQLISGGGGASSRPVVQEKTKDFFDIGHGFLAVTVQGKKLLYQFVGSNGAILREQSLQK